MKNISSQSKFKKTKKTFFGLSLSSIIAAVLLVGVTVAFLASEAVQKSNVFVPGFVDCEVGEEFDGLQKTSIKIQNTGNTEAYIRVDFATYYQAVTGSVIGETATMPEFTLAPGWAQGADGSYYYKYPVAPGEYTGELLGSPITLNQIEDGEGNVTANQTIEVFASAIQAYPSYAVSDAWDAVAAVAGDDDHLILKVKIYDNYANVKHGALYRDVQVNGNHSNANENNWKSYHTGLLNDGYPDADQSLTITPVSGSNTLVVGFYLVNFVEIERFAGYFADFDANITNVDVYAGENEVIINDGTINGIKIGTLKKSSISGDYATDIEAYREIEYSYETETTVIANYVGFVITVKDPSVTIKISEFRIMGYLANRNISSAATYKGDTNTQTLVQSTSTDTGADFTAQWTEYHSGRLNDKTRSSTNDDNKPLEKVIVQSTDGTTDTMRLYFELGEGSIVNAVDVYAGALATLSGTEVVSTVANNAISSVNVYVSETESSEDWQLLGSTTNGKMDTGARYLRIYTVSGKPLYGEYVIIEIKGTPGSMCFGFNEIQIWSNALLALDE